MPNWAWSGYMQPLPIDESQFADFLPGTIGIWDGKIYSVGAWDAAVAMITRKSILDEYGIRIPTLDKPWTKDEFDAALVKLKDARRVRLSARSRHGLDRRMVPLCLLAVPAELRWRPDRPFELPVRGRAC